MYIKTRKTCGFVEVKITIDNTIHDLGFHDREAAAKLVSELLAASLEIQEYLDNWK